jgi:hypothetical protein
MIMYPMDAVFAKLVAIFAIPDSANTSLAMDRVPIAAPPEMSNPDVTILLFLNSRAKAATNNTVDKTPKTIPGISPSNEDALLVELDAIASTMYIVSRLAATAAMSRGTFFVALCAILYTTSYFMRVKNSLN